MSDADIPSEIAAMNFETALADLDKSLEAKPEQKLAVTVGEWGMGVMFRATFCPAHGSLHCLAVVRFITQGRRALIQHHRNVTPDNPLGLNYVLRCEEVSRPIDMRFELHTFFADLPQILERKDLESTGVG